MSNILTLLKEKKKDPVILATNVSIKKAVNIFKTKKVRVAIISDDNVHIDGVLTERDLILGLDKYGSKLLEHTVEEVMTKNVVTCDVDAPLSGLMAQMYDLNIRNIPVVNDTGILGIITMRDLIGVRLKQVQSDADAMRNYISSAG